MRRKLEQIEGFVLAGMVSLVTIVGVGCGGDRPTETDDDPDAETGDVMSDRDGGARDGETVDGTSTDGSSADGASDSEVADSTDGDSSDAGDTGCSEAATRACGTATGVCEQGTQTCNDGTWGDCRGGTSPSDETCDGKDNDCDGMIDENLSRSCGVSTGVCRKGTETCDDGEWSECTGGAGPSTEMCDGKDNDCNGKIDDRVSRSCGKSTGVCEKGTETCSAGTWGSCTDKVGPSQEICDGKDNDCDGMVDEQLSRSCGTSTGVCEKGTETCSSGTWGSCMGNVGPSRETCDGKDNDCDGMVDEQLTRSCGTSTGVCEEGTETCSSGTWGSCTGNVSPSKEVCDNKDNDCDGKTDEKTDVLMTEGFEGTDNRGWAEWTDSGQTSVSRLTISDDATTGGASEGSEYGRATYSTGTCENAAGLGEDVTFNSDIDEISVDVRIDTGAWAEAAIFIMDSSGNLTRLWHVEANGTSYQTNGWKTLTFDEQISYSRTLSGGQTITQKSLPTGLGNEEVTFIFGNGDDGPSCSNNDHKWTLRVDAIEVVDTCS